MFPSEDFPRESKCGPYLASLRCVSICLLSQFCCNVTIKHLTQLFTVFKACQVDMYPVMLLPFFVPLKVPAKCHALLGFISFPDL